ncbi:hypothetical protein V6N11_073684 [Hibiscus sabdariffa]|uniref:Uncharacterized protein n=1 Tax=Hibiscus sabdariffa TaxID=183260 RepID=A0ABR2NU09_9ROSI
MAQSFWRHLHWSCRSQLEVEVHLRCKTCAFQFFRHHRNFRGKASHYCPKIAPLIHVFNRRIGWVYIQGFLGIRLVATDSLQGGRTVGKGDVRRQLNACRDREAGVCISGLGFWVVWAALVSQFGIRLEPGQISRLQFSSSNCRLL